MFNKLKLYFSIFLYIINLPRKYIICFFEFNKNERKRKFFKIDIAFSNIKNISLVLKKLKELSISNYSLIFFNKIPVLFFKNDKYFIKVLNKKFAPRKNYYSNSFEILSHLYNKNPEYFAKPYKYFEDDTFFYYITSNINYNRIEKKSFIEIGKLPSEQKYILLMKIKDIVNLLCDSKIVHGDITRFNILLNKKELKLKLIDFDFAFYANYPSLEDLEYLNEHKKTRAEMDIRNLSNICNAIAGNSSKNIEIKNEIINTLNTKYRSLAS